MNVRTEGGRVLLVFRDVEYVMDEGAAQALGEKLIAGSRAVRREKEHAAEKARVAEAEAKLRATGAVEFVDHHGRTVLGRLDPAPNGLRLRTVRGVESLGIVRRWPTTLRLRVPGGRVAHRWDGCGSAFCGVHLGPSGCHLAAEGLRDCPKCAAKAAAEEVARG